MKLSKVQREVVELMKRGWELGCSTSFDSRCWMQKDGLGRGGETKDVRSSTVFALHKKEVIILTNRGFPIRKYGLRTGV